MATKQKIIALVQKYLEQDDISASIDDLLRLAEFRIEREIRVRAMQITIDPVAIPGDGIYDLPVDFIEISSHVILTDTPFAPVYVPEAQFVALASQSAAGLPTAYTIIGNTIHFSPKPDSTTYMYQMTYYAKLASLINNFGNAIGNFAWDLYVYGTLLECEPYLVNDARIATWQGFYDRAKSSVQKMDGRGRNRPGGAMRPYSSGVREFRGNRR